ncbi:IS66 family insertion sequence element accessory protein TnpB [Acetivibrio mesophilus]|uniref:Transposase n=1 Tax=Acetivibrio mesophilus TaxID=2487273 RepID=A0A4V1K1V3_9FIRM|nr:IS66 family insertion sequence element accessory protein TnpB [Acetivibrio mesophilus]RXE58089.1 transposase [Acetivibrio mesophilus]
MFNDATGFDRIFIACGYTDLRRGIDGLARIVESEFCLDPFQNILLLFCGKRTDRIKGLLWEGDGFVLLNKRLEDGKFQWPRSKKEAKEITQRQFRWLTEGLSIEPSKSVNKVQPKRVF